MASTGKLFSIDSVLSMTITN